MRRRLQTTRVTLREARLPSAAENTELNYRTRITTDRQETATTIRLASIFTLVFIACGFGIRLFAILPLAWGLTVLGLLAAIMLGTAYAKFLQSRPPWSDIGVVPGICRGVRPVRRDHLRADAERCVPHPLRARGRRDRRVRAPRHKTNLLLDERQRTDSAPDGQALATILAALRSRRGRRRGGARRFRPIG